MKITVIGTGYVGLVAGTCFAEIGHKVSCIDVDKEKIKKLSEGKNPIYEPGLKELLKKNIELKRIAFTTNLSKGIENARAVFIAVGTPEKDDGRADLKYVMQVAESIALLIQENTVIVNKSTVPVGTGRKVKKIIESKTSKKFYVVSNPEFLREGCAVKDFMEPDRIVVGADSEYAKKIMKKIYKPLNAKIVFTGIESAEIIKYASNAFLATKISFINEIALLCEKTGGNIKDVARGIGLDSRIGKHFLRAGAGWGGSCFPKDVKALIQTGKNFGVNFLIPRAAEKVNERQKVLPALKTEKLLKGLKNKSIAVLGLAFKPNTDDMRNATSIKVCEYLSSKKAKINAFDPVAEENAKKIILNTRFCPSIEEAVKNVDAVIVLTEWNEIKNFDFKKVFGLMKGNVLIDARNCLDRKKIEKIGFKYEAIGV